jgi:hypothetical protein
MTTASNVLRSLLMYAIVLPLALVVGYLMATPQDFQNMALVGMLVMGLSIPLWMKWHTPLLFLSWNMTAVIFFLPGRPQVWLVMAFGSLLIAVLQRTIVRDMRFIHAPSVTLPVIFLGLVILATAKLTGGIGLRALGSATYGSKAYFWLLGAAGGFFAMLAYRIPPHKRYLYLGLFFLGALTNAIGNTINLVNPAFYYIFLVFPVDMMPGQETQGIARYGGLSVALLGIFWYMLGRYGIRNMLGAKNLGRFLLFALVFVLTLGGGYRSYLILMGLTFVLVFYLEGLFRTNYGTMFLASCLAVGAITIPLADKLPLPIQRSLSFLPLPVDPVARLETQLSTEWRVNLWKAVLPDVPKYFWLGKGLGISGQDLELTSELERNGAPVSEQSSIIAGNYHSGPLSVIITFGVWGAIGWMWFIVASLRALYLNRLYGDESLRTINNLLFALLVAKTAYFFIVFGDFRTDFSVFLGVIGISLSLNGGIRKPAPVLRVSKPIVIRSRQPLQPMPALSRSTAR